MPLGSGFRTELTVALGAPSRFLLEPFREVGGLFEAQLVGGFLDGKIRCLQQAHGHPRLQCVPITVRGHAGIFKEEAVDMAAAQAGFLHRQLPGEGSLRRSFLQTLQNLSSRRGQLDDRERALETQLQLLAAAEAKVDGKLKTLTALKSEISTLLGQADTKVQGEIDRLVIVYSKMKPKDAAAIMSTLDDKVRIPVAAKLKEKDLAAILGVMPTSEAKKITEALASRFNNVKSMAETVQNPPPEPPPPR